MKIQNFRVLETGKGLPHGGQGDLQVMEEFKNDRSRLATAAAQVRAQAKETTN